MQLINKLLLLIFFFSEFSFGARITSMLVPRWVQNETESEIVLDCDYDVDVVQDQNFTLKWYFEDKNNLIYEWIPGYDFRYVSGRLEGRFNWDFMINTSSKHDLPFKRFRAISIRQPTTDLSGRYICQVVSSLGEDSEESTMVVFAPPRDIGFTVKTLLEEQRLLLAYKVERVYPLPQLIIYQSCSGKKNGNKKKLIHESISWKSEGRETLKGHSRKERSHSSTWSNATPDPPFFTLQHVQYLDFDEIFGTYNKLRCNLGNEEEDEVSVIFTLEARIPGTDFVVTRSIQFYPGLERTEIGFPQKLVGNGEGSHGIGSWNHYYALGHSILWIFLLT